MVSLSGRFWIEVNQRLNDPLALIIDIMVSDDDAPMEIWHGNTDSLSNKKNSFCSFAVFGGTIARKAGGRSLKMIYVKEISNIIENWKNIEYKLVIHSYLLSIIICDLYSLCSLMSSTITMITVNLFPVVHVNLSRIVTFNFVPEPLLQTWFLCFPSLLHLSLSTCTFT